MPTTELNPSLLEWDLKNRRSHERYEAFYQTRKLDYIPHTWIKSPSPLWLELGAGTGQFFETVARLHPEKLVVAIERDRMRGKRLERRTHESGLTNFLGIRGNGIPPLISSVPDGRLERLFILYPCPWPKQAHRKHRWYNHPVMPHLKRILTPGGILVWASDQKFYIDEARYLCERQHGYKVLAHGEVAENEWNLLSLFPGGRTKFERTFLGNGQPCYELIVQKDS